MARTGPGGWPRRGRVHDVTCSIGTELAALRAAAVRVVGSDIDPVRLAMARHNVRDGVGLCRADALRPVTRDAVVRRRPGAGAAAVGDASTRDDYQPGARTRCSTPTAAGISS